MKSNKNKRPFLIKLRQMVDNEQGLRWNSNGLLIEVFDQNKLSQAIFKHFRTNKCSTFNRQLTYYQFYTFMNPEGHRIYKNKYFIRDNIELEAQVERNYKKLTSDLQGDDINTLYMENKKCMKQIKELQKNQEQLIKNLQIQNKIHTKIQNSMQTISTYITDESIIADGERFGEFFIQFVSGFHPDLRNRIVQDMQEILGTDLIIFSPIAFYNRIVN